MKLARGLLLTVLLAALAGGLGAWFGARYVVGRHHHETLQTAMLKNLDLTATQSARLEALHADFTVRRAAREAELRRANAELATAIRARHEYSPEVQAAVERIHHAMGELQTETIVHVLDMRRELTPAQAATFDARIDRALTDDPGG